MLKIILFLLILTKQLVELRKIAKIKKKLEKFSIAFFEFYLEIVNLANGHSN